MAPFPTPGSLEVWVNFPKLFLGYADLDPYVASSA